MEKKLKQVRKAVIPAAGLGTRFLPQTKALPKEMLPIVDKPVIQYVVEECVAAGVKEIIIVTGYHKRSIEDHFDEPNDDLVSVLEQGGEEKRLLLERVKQISELANFVYVRQKGPYGNGTPLLNVKHLVGDEPFLYFWSDDFILAEPSRANQLIAAYEKYGCSILSCVRARSDEDYDRYGFAGGKKITRGAIDVDTVIEKPGKKYAPSDLATVSGFLFTPGIFEHIVTALENLSAGEELYYNDALKLLLGEERVIALEIKGGSFYDTGNKLEYLKTVVEFALRHPDINGEFRSYLKGLKL